ncbi:TniQ family protein [Gordonia iterans]
MLPARVAIDPRESLDSYLERLALVNDLTSSSLVGLLRENHDGSSPSTAFMLVRPSDKLASRIMSLTGLGEAAVEQSTLARYDSGVPLNLEGFDPLDRASYRTVVAQGWFPQHGTQLCPLCLRRDGIWQLAWRLPISAVCLEHDVHLVAECSDCGRRFRTRYQSPLRPHLDNDQPCGNSLGSWTPCRHSVLDESPLPASDGARRAAIQVADAINGKETRVLGATLAPAAYLAEIRNLSTLLLHLATRPQAQGFVDWAGALQAEAASRTTELRGPRWGIQPPRSALVRGEAMSEAATILASRELQDAVMRLADWFDLIAAVPGGPQSWLVNRAAMSPVLSWLIVRVLSSRRHVGLQIDHQDGLVDLPLSAIPQLLDQNTYRRHFGGMLATLADTGRLYASLCIARAQAPGTNWCTAAASIGLAPDVGRRISRAASTRLIASPQEFAEATNAAARDLPSRRDYRALERRVIELAHTPTDWFTDWARSAKPKRRAVAIPYAVTWMWCEVAQGWLDTSPAWPPPVARQSKAAYRVFRDALPDELGATLRKLVETGSTVEARSS